MRLSIKQKQALWAYSFIAVPVIFFMCIRIYPTLYSFNISFRQWDLLSKDKPFVLFKNFQMLPTDEVFIRAMLNTAKYVLIGVPSVLVISLCVALLLNSVSKGAGFFRMIYFIPYVTPIVAVSWVWRWMFMKQGGVINYLIGLFGVKQQPFLDSTSQAIHVVISNVVWQGLGFYIIIFLAGIKQISRIYYEASSIDGASPWVQFKRITVPLLNPTIVYLTVMATIQTLQVFTQVYNITAGGQGNPGGPLNSTLSIVLYIYQLAFKSFKMGYASAVTVVLFVIILTISLVQLKFLSKKVEY